MSAENSAGHWLPMAPVQPPTESELAAGLQPFEDLGRRLWKVLEAMGCVSEQVPSPHDDTLGGVRKIGADVLQLGSNGNLGDVLGSVLLHKYDTGEGSTTTITVCCRSKILYGAEEGAVYQDERQVGVAEVEALTASLLGATITYSSGSGKVKKNPID